MSESFKRLPKREPGSHPECLKNETFIGNYTAENFRNLGYKTKRVGNMPLDPYGNPINDPNLSPVFVETDEIKRIEWAYEGGD